MARRRSYSRGRRRSSGGMTIPIAPVLGLVVGMGPGVTEIIKGDYILGLRKIGDAYTGFDFGSPERGWRWGNMATGLFPLVVGLLVHKFVGGKPLNLNGMLARAKVPFIRI